MLSTQVYKMTKAFCVEIFPGFIKTLTVHADGFSTNKIFNSW